MLRSCPVAVFDDRPQLPSSVNSKLATDPSSIDAELIPLTTMSSPRASRAWDMPSSSSSYKPYSISRRSSSSIRLSHQGRARNESSSSLLPYDPDTYTDDLVTHQDVIFDGPSASSVPTSVTSFAHRGSRTSFADEDRTAVRFFAEEFDEDAEEVLTEIDPEEEDRHSVLSSSRASEGSRSSVAVTSTPDVERGGQEFPLILRRKSTDQRSDVSGGGARGRVTQKIYLADEDMVVVMSGFKTRIGRLWMYRALSVVTFGLFYLLMRWLPRWRLRFMAEPLPLSEAHWVVVEVPPSQKCTFNCCRTNIQIYRHSEYGRQYMAFHYPAVLPPQRQKKQKTTPSSKEYITWTTDTSVLYSTPYAGNSNSCPIGAILPGET